MVSAKTDEAQAVMAEMHRLPTADEVVRNAKLRIDGRMTHDFYVFQIKSPAASKGPWDYYDLVATIPGEEAFRPLAQSTCPAPRK